ncbi:hypothetical protein BsWGS_25892 [Bradybaena similaris]
MEQPKVDRRNTEALQLLHPVCKSLMTDMCKENVVRLVAVLGQVDASVLQHIQQYILFPIQSGLHVKNMSESLLYSLCEALVLILKKTEVFLTVTFFDIFNPLVFSITPVQGSSKVSGMAEDTKIMVVQAIMSLLEASSDKVLSDFYRFSYLPALGQVISVLLSLAQMEKSRCLQILALDCILVILQTSTKYGKINEVHLGNLFAFCLPGVTMATSKIITGDSKQGHLVFMKALKVWDRIVTLALSDSLLEKAQDGLQKQREAQDFPQGLNVKRDESWVKVTASKLKILVGQVCKVVSHSSWKVRLSLADTAEHVLLACCRSLSDSVPHFLEALVGLIGDDYGNVAKRARTALEAFSASQAGTSGESRLVQILEENLYNMATALPRRLKMCDEDEKPVIIKLFNGYISLLGPRIDCVIESAPHLQRVSLALLQGLDMDVSNISILEERGSLLYQEPEVFTGTDSLKIWRPRKYFKHFRDEGVLAELLLACRQLGKFGNVCTIVDHFLDLYHESSVYRLAAILVINEVIVGAGSRFNDMENGSNMDNHCDREVLDSVTRALLDEYLSADSLKVIDRLSDGASFLQQQPSSSSSSQSLASSLVVVKSDLSLETHKTSILRKNQAILQVSLCMEGVGKIASVLKRGFQVHLIQALYPLLENLGHENSHVSSSAYTALVEVAVACGYSSLDSLIRDNADYLTGSLSLRLRHFDENPRSPRTFCVMLRYSTHDLLPQVSHSITQLLDSLDDNYLDSLVLFLPVLEDLLCAIGRWFPISSQKQKEDVRLPVAAPGTSSPEVYAAHFVERIKTRLVEMGLFSDDETEHLGGATAERDLGEVEANWQKLLEEQQERKDEDEDTIDDCEEKKEPQYVAVVKEVLKRVKNLLCAQDGRLRVLALDVVCQAIRDLAGHERELLPQIHELWPGFVPLFHSQEKFIVIKALNTLLVMAELGGDFIKQRTMKDVIPSLASFMEKQAKISSQSRSAYTFTGPYKLQLCVLSTMGPLARHLDLRQDCNSLERVARMCLPYLSCLQPEALQKASKGAFTNFISIDSDAMWLLLCQSYCPSVPIHKCQLLTPVKFQNDPTSKSDLARNISELFQTHYGH